MNHMIPLAQRKIQEFIIIVIIAAAAAAALPLNKREGGGERECEDLKKGAGEIFLLRLQLREWLHHSSGSGSSTKDFFQLCEHHEHKAHVCV